MGMQSQNDRVKWEVDRENRKILSSTNNKQ